MAVFAIIQNNKVINLVEAEELNGRDILSTLIDSFDEIVLVAEETKPAFIGASYENDKFMPIKPYPSWIFNSEIWAYEAPVAYPDRTKPYNWNEETQSWDDVVFE